jgi:hypothetical protein
LSKTEAKPVKVPESSWRGQQPSAGRWQMTDDVTRILRDAYDRKVDERDVRPAPATPTAGSICR